MKHCLAIENYNCSGYIYSSIEINKQNFTDFYKFFSILTKLQIKRIISIGDSFYEILNGHHAIFPIDFNIAQAARTTNYPPVCRTFLLKNNQSISYTDFFGNEKILSTASSCPLVSFRLFSYSSDEMLLT